MFHQKDPLLIDIWVALTGFSELSKKKKKGMNFRVGILYETWEELQEGTKDIYDHD